MGGRAEHWADPVMRAVLKHSGGGTSQALLSALNIAVMVAQPLV